MGGVQREPGVDWEMVARWQGSAAEKVQPEIELRALSKTEVEIKAAVYNSAYGWQIAYRTTTFDSVRKALDELERSAKEVERL